MIKSILTHLCGTHTDEAVLSLSLDIARLYAGHLECLHIRANSADLLRQASQIDLGTSTVLADALNTLEHQSNTHAKRAQNNFAEFCKRSSVVQLDTPPGSGTISASWREACGDEADYLTAQGRFHDLVALAGGADRPGRLPAQDLGRIIIGCGRPVLLAPQKVQSRNFKTIAIAWKNTAESARAVTAAMPILSQAAHIDVLSANEENEKALECVSCSESVVGQLRWHRLNARGHYVLPAGRTAPDAVLETAQERGADLLVMGGYGHSRLREFIFGGFTKRILDGASLPVLVFH